MSNKRKNSTSFLLISMGVLSAFGPFVTDFYLPAFPIINDYFRTSPSMVQLSLTTGLLGLGAGQLIVGPVSDKYGRKKPLLGSLLLFIISTVACLFSWNIEVFIFFRLIQGMAGSGGVVISKSVATDLYKGERLTKFFSMLMVVNGLGPIMAPVLGGLLMKVTDWKGIFILLLVLGLLLLLLNLFFIESLAEGKRVKGSILSSYKSFVYIFKNKRFMYFVLTQAFAMGLLFAYISSSPFLFQVHYKLGPVAYSLCFALNAFGIMAGSWFVSFFSGRRALWVGNSGIVLMGAVFAFFLIAGSSVLWIEFSLFLLMVFLGLILPSSAALALDLERKNGGSASAILGFMAFLAGSMISPLVGIGDLIWSVSSAVVVCGLLSLVFSLLALRKRN